MAKAGKKESGTRQPASQNGTGSRAAKTRGKGRASKAPEAVVEAVEVAAVAPVVAGGGEGARADAAALRDELRAAREEVAELRRQCKLTGEKLESLTEENRAALRDALDGVRRLSEEVGSLRSRVTEIRAAADEGERAEAAPAPEVKKNRFGVTVAAGVVVADVTAGSPAEEAGVLRGDVIEEANGVAVHNGDDLSNQADRVAPGEDLTLQIRRGGELVVRTVKLGETSAEGGSRFGVTVAPGVVVAEVFAGSPAEAAGLARGDVIEDAGGQVVHSGEQLLSIVHAQPEGADVPLVVTRSGERREIVAHLDRA